MVTTENKVEFTSAFIKNFEVKDEDLKQTLYLVALESTPEKDESDAVFFGRLIKSFDDHLKRFNMCQQEKERVISIGVCKGFPIDIISVPDDLMIFLNSMLR
jgi:hypothetical protein